MKKKILLILAIFLLILLLYKDNSYTDALSFKGKKYILLKFKTSNFTYYHNNYNNNYYEEDVITKVPHDKWDVVYFNGDLYINKKQVKEATKYYADDNNYSWYIDFDYNDEIVRKKINLSKKEITNLYNLEKAKRDKTIVFDDIQMFADILKISNDKLVQALIVIAKVDNNWYYKTEIMTDDNREYAVKLIDSVNKKIKDKEEVK